jgi:hypothetical protein
MAHTLALPPSHPAARASAALWRDGWRGDRTLMRFAVVMFALLLPLALGLLLDDRLLRGANVWLKPMKFALSLAVFAWTTAYFMRHVDPARRAPLALVRWMLIGTATFEIVYIVLQAARGEGSHYNVGDALHGTLYTLMGIGAVLLTATQGVLAWLVARHARPGLDPAYRLAVVTGLAFAFVLGTASGAPLSALQPADASALPGLGWHLAGDLRPAHFVGLHAEQVLPLVGAWTAARGWRHARGVVVGVAVAWAALFAALFVLGLRGAY